jgi:hypothetical protein
MKGLLPIQLPNAPPANSFRISEQLPNRQPFMQSPGMIVRQDLATNAAVGVGLAQIRGRKKGLAGARDVPVRSHRPAVSFILKF